MSNPSKQKGTQAESAVVKYMRLSGFPGADRMPLRGNKDAGDVGLCPGLVLEIKSSKLGGAGQPAQHLLASWMAQAAAERYNAGAAMCPLIVKRAGTTDVSRWWSYLPLGDLLELTGATAELTNPPITAPVCMSVGSLVALLHAAGYGYPPMVEATS